MFKKLFSPPKRTEPGGPSNPPGAPGNRLPGDRASGSLGPAFTDVELMLDQAAKMLDHALASLLDNKPLEVDLEDLDDIVDQAEWRVRQIVLSHLKAGPQDDLVVGLVLVSVVHDAERIGDFARGLAELVPLAKSPRTGPFNERLAEAAAVIRPLFAATKRCFRENDPELARLVVATATQNKRSLIALTRDIAASDVSTDLAVVYSCAARMLRRIGAHLSNIASSASQPYERIRHDDEPSKEEPGSAF